MWSRGSSPELVPSRAARSGVAPHNAGADDLRSWLSSAVFRDDPAREEARLLGTSQSNGPPDLIAGRGSQAETFAVPCAP